MFYWITNIKVSALFGYVRCFSKDWDVTDYGVCELADLLSEIPDTTICISKQDEDTVISIPKRGILFLILSCCSECNAR